jgi:hypothetical protein
VTCGYFESAPSLSSCKWLAENNVLAFNLSPIAENFRRGRVFVCQITQFCIEFDSSLVAGKASQHQFGGCRDFSRDNFQKVH